MSREIPTASPHRSAGGAQPEDGVAYVGYCHRVKDLVESPVLDCPPACLVGSWRPPLPPGETIERDVEEEEDEAHGQGHPMRKGGG